MFWYIAKALQDIGDVLYHALSVTVRELLTIGTIAKILALKPSSLQGIGRVMYILSLGRYIPPQFNTVLEVPGIESGKVRWFSKAHVRERSDPVLILFHGGGYLIGMSLYHAFGLREIWKIVSSPRLSIVWADYTLSSQERFPRQLVEAEAIYREVLKTSDNISLIGDSAGGHLSLMLLRSIHRESLPKPHNVLLISPWCELLPSLEPLRGSYAKYKYADAISGKTSRELGELAVPLNDPEMTEDIADLTKYKHWPEVLPSPDHVYVGYGEREVLRDCIETFINIAGIKTGGGKVFMEKDGVHDSPLERGCGHLRLGGNPIIEHAGQFYKAHLKIDQ